MLHQLDLNKASAILTLAGETVYTEANPKKMKTTKQVDLKALRSNDKACRFLPKRDQLHNETTYDIATSLNPSPVPCFHKLFDSPFNCFF